MSDNNTKDESHPVVCMNCPAGPDRKGKPMEIAFRPTSLTFTGGMVISVNGEEKGTLRHNGRILFELQGDEAVTVQIRQRGKARSADSLHN